MSEDVLHTALLLSNPKQNTRNYFLVIPSAFWWYPSLPISVHSLNWRKIIAQQVPAQVRATFWTPHSLLRKSVSVWKAWFLGWWYTRPRLSSCLSFAFFYIYLQRTQHKDRRLVAMDHFVDFSASTLLFILWPKVECACLNYVHSKVMALCLRRTFIDVTFLWNALTIEPSDRLLFLVTIYPHVSEKWNDKIKK